MKIYNEEQVRKAIELARDTHQEGRPYLERDEYDYSEDEVVNKLTPIELPSDEEIWQEADKEDWDSKDYAFTRGAKWMRDKIQGGNI